MAPYYLVFLILVILSFLQLSEELCRYRIVFVVIGAATLVLFAGLRSIGVGQDDLAYWREFRDVPPIGHLITRKSLFYIYDLKFEPLYTLLSSIIKQFSDNYSVLFFSVAAIAVTLTSVNYNKYSRYACVCLLLYFSHTFLLRDMNQIRAGVAAAIGLFLIAQIGRRQHFRTVVTIGAASLFHVGALAFVLPWLLSFIRWRREWVVVAVIVGAVLGTLGVSSWVIGALPDLGSTTDRIKDYAYSQYHYNLGLLDITNIKNLAIISVVMFYWGPLSKRVQYFDIIVLFFAISVVWRLVFSDFAIIAARIATFFGIVEVLIVSSFIILFKNRMVGLIIVLFYGFAMLTLNLFVTKIPPYSIAGL